MTRLFKEDSIIYLDGFVSCLSKEEVREDDYFLSANKQHIIKANDSGAYHATKTGQLKIVATNNPSLEGAPKLKLSEDKWAREKAIEDWNAAKSIMEKMDETMSLEQQAFFVSGHSYGYKAASKKKWSDEDMRNMLLKFIVKYSDKPIIEPFHGMEVLDWFDNYIKTLTPKIKEIELEVEEFSSCGYNDPDDQCCDWHDNGCQGHCKIVQNRPKLDDKGFVIVKNIVYE